MFSDDDAVCVFLSDHGLDIYDTDPKFVGHAKADSLSVSAAERIPFFICLSNNSLLSHPELAKRVRYASENSHPYNTEDMMYTIADLMGIVTIDHKSVSDNSIIH